MHPPSSTTKAPREHTTSARKYRDRMSPSWQLGRYLTSSLSILPKVAHWYAMRAVRDAKWEPTVPALVNLVAASGAPGLRAAFAAARLDGIPPARADGLVTP